MTESILQTADDMFQSETGPLDSYWEVTEEMLLRFAAHIRDEALEEAANQCDGFAEIVHLAKVTASAKGDDHYAAELHASALIHQFDRDAIRQLKNGAKE